MTRFETLPIIFDQNGNPDDKILYDAAQAFAIREFKESLNFRKYLKVWADIKISDEGEGYEVMGLVAVAYAIDCPLFHVKEAPEDGAPHERKLARDQTRDTRDRLMRRAAGYVQDNSGPGTDVLVFVSPQKERFWKGFLRLIRARVAGRYIVRV